MTQNLDSLLDMYLAGAADVLRGMTAKLEGSVLPDRLEAMFEDLMCGLIRQKFGVTTNLVLLVTAQGFRFAYRSGLATPVKEVRLIDESNLGYVPYKFKEEKFGVRVLCPDGNTSPEPYIWQET